MRLEFKPYGTQRGVRGRGAMNYTTCLFDRVKVALSDLYSIGIHPPETTQLGNLLIAVFAAPQTNMLQSGRTKTLQGRQHL
jgi:hypothetical protein